MKKNGAEVIPVYSGSQTLVDAVSECMRYWVANCDKVAMCVGSTVGPAVFVRICGWSTSQISRELKTQLVDEFGSVPKNSNFIIVLEEEVLVLVFGMSLWIMIKNSVNLLV